MLNRLFLALVLLALAVIPAQAASPNIDAGTHATVNITSFSSAASFTSSANIFETSGTNELAVAVIAYGGMALAGGGVTSFTVTANAVVLTFSLYSKVQGPSSSHYQTIEVWTCQSAAQFNSGAASTTTALVLSQTIDDAVVSINAVQGLHSIGAPFDPNVSIPNGTVVTSMTTPPILTFSTSNPDDLLFFISAEGDTPSATGTPIGWTSVGGGTNGGGARYQDSNVSIKSVSSKQSSATVQDNNTTISLNSWSAIVGAFTGDASGGGFPSLTLTGSGP